MNIYTWGYGKEVWDMLNGVKFFVANDFYMLAIMFAAMLFMLLIRFMQSGQIGWQMFLVSMMTVTIFLKPHSMTFNIVDEATGYGSTISDIPVGLGVILSLESALEKAMLEKIEESFSTPNGVSFKNAGMGFSFIAPLVLMDAEPQDAYLQQTFNHYMNNCFLYDIAQGNIDLNNIANTPDLLNSLAPTVMYETMVFDSDHTRGVEQDCQTAYNNIKARIAVEATNYLDNTLPQKMGMTGSANFSAALSDTQQLLHQASVNTAAWVEQETMRNMLDKGFKATATLTGGEVATTAWSAAVAKAATNQTWRMTGIQAKNNLPLVRSIGISLLIGVSSIIAFYAVATVSFRALFMVFGGFFTLGLWSPIAAIINFMVYRKAEDVLPPIFGSIANADVGLEQISMYAANLEWWYGAIPMISYMIITGGGMGAMYLLRDAAAGSGSGSGAGTDAAKGNINYGNSQVRNESYNEKRANHEDYVDSRGEHHRLDSMGGHSYAMSGTDATGGGYTARSSTSATGGGIVETQNAAGKSNINYNSSGLMIDSTWDNSSITNRVSDSSSASVREAREQRQQASETLASDLSYSIGEMRANGQNVQDAQTLSNHFGVDHTSSKEISEAVRQSEQKAILDNLSNTERAEIKKVFGERWEGKIGGGLSLGVKKAGTGGDVGISGGVSGWELNDRTSQKSYTHDFSSSEKEEFEHSYSKNLKESLTEKNGVLAQYANSVKNDKTHADSTAKTHAENYNQAITNLDAVTKQNDLVHTQAQENGANLNGQILQDYINQDPTLSRKWNNAKNDNQRSQVASTAQAQIQKALLDPGANPDEYAKVQDAIGTVAERYGHNGLFNDVKNNIKNYEGGGQKEIRDGRDKIERKEIDEINEEAVKLRLNRRAGEDIANINATQNPFNKVAIGEKQAALNILESARKDIGVKEDKRPEVDNHRISEYHRSTGNTLDDDTAWCGSFVNFHVKEAGLQGTNSPAAASWRDWGHEVEPQVGAIAVKSRFENGVKVGDHVGIVDKINENGTMDVLGGNQGKDGKVKLSTWKINDFDSFRMPTAKEGLDPNIGAMGFNNIHKGMAKINQEQYDRANNIDAPALPGAGAVIKDEGELYATKHNPNQAWDYMENTGIIKQAGAAGSVWEPGKNYNEKIAEISSQDIRRALTLNESVTGGYRMSGDLEKDFKKELSDRAIKEIASGDTTNFRDVIPEDLSRILRKKKG